MNITLIIKSENYCWVTKTSEFNNIGDSITRYMNKLLELQDPGYLLLAKKILKGDKENKYQDLYDENGLVVDNQSYIRYLPQLDSDVLTLYTYQNK